MSVNNTMDKKCLLDCSKKNTKGWCIDSLARKNESGECDSQIPVVKREQVTLF